MCEQIPRDWDARGPCFRSLNAVVTLFHVNAEMKVLLELLSLLVDIWRGGVKILSSRAEILFQQNLQKIFEMTELSKVVHTEASRKTLILGGTTEGHDICPILLLHLTLAQGNQQNQYERASSNAKSPQGNASVARFELLFHTLSRDFLQYFRNY